MLEINAMEVQVIQFEIDCAITTLLYIVREESSDTFPSSEASLVFEISIEF